MCYTSGTTGHPKGVVYSHRSSVLHSLGAMLADTVAVSERDVVMPVVPMFHANAWGLAHAGVMAGSALAFPGPQMTPAAIAELIEDEKVTLAAGVPTIWMGALDELEGRDTVCAAGDPVRRLGGPAGAVGGLPRAARPADPARLGHDRDEPARLGLPDQEHARRPLREELADVRSTQGIVTPLVECRIVEPGTATSCRGTARRAASCRSPARGSRPATTATRRDGDSFTDDGWLRTGDVATITPDGYIRLVDRTKDLVKSGGEWISSVELENEIMAHPSVREAAVIGVPDERWGERPLACVVAEDGAELDADALREFLSDRVAKWWIPERSSSSTRCPRPRSASSPRRRCGSGSRA